MTTIKSFPNEILFDILGLSLSGREKLVPVFALLAVCKRWRAIVLSMKHLWKSLQIEALDENSAATFTQLADGTIVSLSSSLSHLYLSGVDIYMLYRQTSDLVPGKSPINFGSG
jgi:hypothetical protein